METVKSAYEPWWAFARCKGMDQEIFYPPPGVRRNVAYRAQQICAGCPVIEPCLQAALDEERGLGIAGVFGVRGGKTAAERVRLNGGIPRWMDDPLPSTCRRGHPWTDSPHIVETVRGPRRVCLTCKEQRAA